MPFMAKTKFQWQQSVENNLGITGFCNYDTKKLGPYIFIFPSVAINVHMYAQIE